MKPEKKNPKFNLKQLGNTGEDIAASYLSKKGYKIIDRNFKVRYGELDIVAIYENTLVIVEVKTRIGNKFGTPEEAITSYKLKELIQTTELYKLKNPQTPDLIRIDLVGIQMRSDKSIENISHIENISQ